MSSTVRPVLRVKRHSVVPLLQRAYAVAGGLAADPARFPEPHPPVACLQKQIGVVEATYKLSLTRAKGTAAACRAAGDVLYGMLESERLYVRTLCDASPNEATAVIQAAGMEVAIVGPRPRPVLSVERGGAPGTAELRAGVSLLLGNRAKRAKFFDWQWTADGGQTFHAAPTTVAGRTLIIGLTPLTLVGFRVKATTNEGAGEWSPIVSIVIH